MGLIAGYEVWEQGLPKAVSKPENVRYWLNLWSSRDPFSNAILAADANVQIDAGLGLPEYDLAQLSVDQPYLRLQINKDIAAIENAHAWHKAYYKGFRASLETLNMEINIDAFDADIAPQLAACLGAK